MKKNHLLLMMLLATTTALNAQTQFWSDTFEDSGAPSSGTRTPSVSNSSGGPPSTRYFMRTATSGISLVSTYTNVEGTKFWAGEDHRLSPISQSGHQNVTWTGINISGNTGMTFKGMFACGPANFDIPPSSPVSDYVIVEYRIDGGTWTSGLRFFPYNPTIATYLSLETTGDSVGEGVTLLNSANFTEFSFNLTGTGTTLDLRLKAHSNGTSEEWAADNFRLFYASAMPVEVSEFDVSCDKQGTVLNWTVESEYNFNHYEIEQSDNLTEFRTIGSVEASLNAAFPVTYEFRPVQQDELLHYYRLKAVDNDGSTAFHGPVSTSCIYEESPSVFDYYTTQSNGLTLHFLKKGITIELLDLSGRVLYTQTDYQEEILKLFQVDYPTIVLLRLTDLDGKAVEYKRLFTR